MNPEVQDKKIGYINQSQYDPTTLTGTLYWGTEKYRITNFLTNGTVKVADIRRKTGEKYTAKNGNMYDEYVTCGALKYDVDSGEGEMILEIDGKPEKHQFKTFIDKQSDGSDVRKLRFQQGGYDNIYRNMLNDGNPQQAEQVKVVDLKDIDNPEKLKELGVEEFSDDSDIPF